MSEPLPLFCALRIADLAKWVACLTCRLRGGHRWRAYGWVGDRAGSGCYFEACDRCAAARQVPG